jgi:hypothetical protein
VGGKVLVVLLVCALGDYPLGVVVLPIWVRTLRCTGPQLDISANYWWCIQECWLKQLVHTFYVTLTNDRKHQSTQIRAQNCISEFPTQQKLVTKIHTTVTRPLQFWVSDYFMSWLRYQRYVGAHKRRCWQYSSVMRLGICDIDIPSKIHISIQIGRSWVAGGTLSCFNFTTHPWTIIWHTLGPCIISHDQ